MVVSHLFLLVVTWEVEPEQYVLGLVVPGDQATELAEVYREAILDGSGFQSQERTCIAQWGVESQTKLAHLLAAFDNPPLVLDVCVPATGRFQRPLQAAYERPAGTHLLVVLYDSEADAEQANKALEAGDFAVWRSLGVAVGDNPDVRPLVWVFGR